MYPHKAVLQINGDLNDMVKDWTEEEREAKRRVVKFRRSQDGNTITADFEPVSPQDLQPNSICVSCIYWEAKKECFVTSVDTIQLLESLVAVRFTVEEKNRIRRNLEGFRPMTISKAKADSEDFFKLIMGFPSPKPRNIEKDVKVFPWSVLTLALKKIIGKYVRERENPCPLPLPSRQRQSLLSNREQSASYSSTASALATPTAMQTYVGVAQQDLGGDALTSPSSRDLAGSAAAYGAFVATIGAPLGPQVTNGNSIGAYLAGGQAMPMSHAYGGEPLEYRAQEPHPPQAHPSGPAAVYPMMGQAPRASFDFAPYLDAGASGAQQADSHYYPADPQQDGSHYHMTHASSGA
jgi:hypothetical protein